MHSGQNIASALQQNAVRRGAHPAIVEGKRTYTYDSLDQQVRQIADYLVTLGAGEGTLVGEYIKGQCRTSDDQLCGRPNWRHHFTLGLALDRSRDQERMSLF